MADIQVGEGHTPDEEQQMKQRVRDLLDDFDAVGDDIIGAYEGLNQTQRQTVGQALINWNKTPADLGEVTTNLNALYALCGFILAVLALVIRRELKR